MSFKTQLCRWLHKRFSHNYTQAGYDGFYNILLSSIQRDSGLLDKGDMKAKRRKIERALNELGNNGVIKSYDHRVLLEGRKIVDVKYHLFPSDDFISEMRAANKRFKNTKENLGAFQPEKTI